MKRCLIIVVFTALLIKVSAACLIPLTPDESLHWMQSRHLAWGFADHPPGTAFLDMAGTSILGTTTAGIRIFAVLSTLACSIIAAAILKQAGAENSAVYKGAILLQAVPLMFFGLIMVPVFPFASIILLCEYFFLRALNTDSKMDHLLWGLFLGIATLIYYMSATAIAAVIAFCVLDQKGRALLRNPRFWTGVAVSVAVVAPNVVWNLNQGSHSAVVFQLAERSPYEFAPMNSFAYAAAAFVIAGPLYLPAMAMSVKNLLKQKETGNIRLFSLLVVVPFLAFLILSPFREVGAHWAVLSIMNAPLYLALKSGQGRHWSGWESVTVGVSCGVMAAVLAVLFVGIQKTADVIDPQHRMVSERELGLFLEADEAGRIAGSTAGHSSGKTGFIADNWGQAGLLSFYTSGNPYYHLYPLSKGHGRDYAKWNMEHDRPATALVVTSRRKLKQEIKDSFSSLRPLHKEINGFPSQYGLYEGKGFRPDKSR